MRSESESSPKKIGAHIIVPYNSFINLTMVDKFAIFLQAYCRTIFADWLRINRRKLESLPYKAHISFIVVCSWQKSGYL